MDWQGKHVRECFELFEPFSNKERAADVLLYLSAGQREHTLKVQTYNARAKRKGA